MQPRHGFAANGPGIDVISKPQVGWMTELSVCRPFCKFHLGHKLGCDPVRPLVCRGALHEGTRVAFQLLLQCIQAGERGVSKAGSCVAHVPQPLIVIDPKQQCAEVSPGSARFGPAANDKFLLLHDSESQIELVVPA